MNLNSVIKNSSRAIDLTNLMALRTDFGARADGRGRLFVRDERKRGNGNTDDELLLKPGSTLGRRRAKSPKGLTHVTEIPKFSFF